MVAHTNKNFISNPFIQQDLQQRELDVVQREISVLLKEQTLESHHQKGKKKKKSKGDKIGSPRNFEHFVAVRRGDGGLKVSSRKVIENSILPISNRPFVGHNSDSEPETSNSSNKGLFYTRSVEFFCPQNSIWSDPYYILLLFSSFFLFSDGSQEWSGHGGSKAFAGAWPEKMAITRQKFEW